MSDALDREKLAEALKAWGDWWIHGKISDLRGFDHKSQKIVTSAARRLLEAEEVWWCKTHKHQAIWISPEDGSGFCCRNGRLPSGGVDCVMVLGLLADPEETG